MKTPKKSKGQNPKQFILQNFEQMEYVDTIVDSEHGKVRLFRLDPFCKYLASKLVCSVPASKISKLYEEQLIKQYQERCRIKHPHIIYTMGCESQKIMSETSQGTMELFQVYVFFEHMQLNIEELLMLRREKKYMMPEVEAWCFAKGIISGLLYLSENLIYHGKLSLKTIYFDEEYLLYRIYDQELISGPLKNMSLCQEYLQGNTKHIDEQEFKDIIDLISPECKELMNEELSIVEERVNPYKCDVYAFGIIMIKMLSLNKKQTIQKGIGALSSLYSNQLIRLIKACVQEDPKTRPDWNELTKLVEKLQSQMNVEDRINDKTLMKPTQTSKSNDEQLKTIKNTKSQSANSKQETTKKSEPTILQNIEDIDRKLINLNNMIQSILDQNSNQNQKKKIV